MILLMSNVSQYYFKAQKLKCHCVRYQNKNKYKLNPYAAPVAPPPPPPQQQQQQ